MTRLAELLQRPASEHRIRTDMAKQWMGNWRNNIVDVTHIEGFSWPNSVLKALLDTEGSAGFREYNGINDENEMVSILVSLDKQGEPMWEAGVYELSHPCPPFC